MSTDRADRTAVAGLGAGPGPTVHVSRIAIQAALLVGAAIMILPFLAMVSTSLKPQAEVFSDPGALIPHRLTFDAYLDIWDRIPFARFFINSVVFAGGVTALSLLFDSMAAYALARLRFRGQRVFFWIVLIVLMVPFQITLVPLFMTVFGLGWLDSFAGLIIPRATNAFGIFMLRQFFLSLPRDFDDAARIDGASEWRIFWKIALPLSLPALATLGIFHFMYNWNDFLWPLIITTSTDMRTLPAGLTLFMGSHVVEHSVLMAGATIAIAPLVVAFVLAQRHFVRGVVMTGLK